MSSEAKDLSQSSYTLQEFDDIFFSILARLGADAIKGASECTESIFRLSSNYVDKPAFASLKEFYDLYFGESSMESNKDQVNKDVDELFEAIQKKIQVGGDASEVEEDEAAKKRRLAMSGVQKQLEGLITLNAGIKEQIIPALSSMQFEDAISQRIDHLLQGWKKINDFLHNMTMLDAEPLARELAGICSSVEETESFYRLILDEEPPVGGEAERSIFLEF